MGYDGEEEQSPRLNGEAATRLATLLVIEDGQSSPSLPAPPTDRHCTTPLVREDG